MATVSLILRTDKKKKDGTMPINFLIIKDRIKTKIATNISIDPKYWDKKRERLNPEQRIMPDTIPFCKINWLNYRTKFLNI